MSWTQVSERRWERPANGMEGFFIFMENTSASLFDGCRQYTIFSRIKLDLVLPGSDSDVVNALRHAWKQVRYEQPQIAVTVSSTDETKNVPTKIYEVPEDKHSLAQWLDTTFIISSDLDDSERLAREAKPNPQATLYYLPKTSELVIRAPHSLIDGVGMLLLWHTYLTALTSHPLPDSEIVFGEEAVRLPPSLEKALGHPDTLPEDLATKGAQVAADALSAMPGIGPVNRMGTVPAGPTQRRELVLSAQETQQITQTCKQNGYSVTAAVHAALALTVIKHADPALTKPDSKYVTVNSFNFRSFLPEPYNSAQCAVALYYAIWPLVLDRPEGDEFGHLVRAIHENYSGTFKGNAENVALCGSVTNGLHDIVRDPAFLEAAPARDPLLSSLGIVERFLQREYGETGDAAATGRRAVVRDFKLGIEVILGHSMCFLYTFRDCMRLVYSFNEAYEDEVHIQAYLEDVRNVLLAELVD